MKKKLLSLLLVLVIVLGMFPVSAMAAGSAPTDWYNFRNSDVNMAITAAPTPVSKDYTQLTWTKTFDENDYVGTPILVGGSMYLAAGSKLYQLETADGSVIDSADLATPVAQGPSGVAPTYVQEKGLIIVPLDNGIVQAFRVSDLTSTWSYTDSLGGQMLTPMAYADGKLYGGFYNSETADANFVCLNAETGAKEWYYTHTGGFYWAGPVVVGDYVVVGTDNGVGTSSSAIAAASSWVLSFSNEGSGAADPVSKLELAGIGDQRSSMAYDGGRVYFTTKNGYICSAAVSDSGELTDLKSHKDEYSTKSVGTPVVYGDYVYYGISSKYFVVADKDTLETQAKVTMLGSPAECSFLLSTAYESEGFLYFYGTYNKKPGGLTLVKVSASDPTDAEVMELYDAKGFEEYCNASPICDANGSIYYKNDSRTVFALSPVQVKVPVISKNLSTDVVKYNPNAAAAALVVDASAETGAELTYQWQSSTDGQNWSDIAGQTAASYTPSTAELGKTWYRCVVTAAKDGKTASTASDAACIEVKDLATNAGLNVMVNNKYNATDSTSAKAVFDGHNVISLTGRTDTVGYLWLGTEDYGTIQSVDFLQGVPSKPAFSSKSGANATYDGVVYNGYYRSTKYALPIVAKAVVAAEDTSVTKTYYIVIEAGDTLGRYTVAVDGFTAEPADQYSAEAGISFTEAGQSVVLTPVTQTIGTGEEDKSGWSWSSSDETVAAVDENGVVKCIGGGTATITFTCGTLTKTCTVTSDAPAHTTHSYSDGKCSVCGADEPTAVTAWFSLAKEGKFVKAKDNSTDLWRVEVTVGDEDRDGTLTLNDAFLAAHEAYSAGGAADFVTEMGSYGLEIKKLWGVETSVVGYYLNDKSANGLSDALKAGDRLTAYFMRADYSDLYTYFDKDSVSVVVNTETTFTAKADTWGSAVVPKGATVTVCGSNGVVDTLTTTVGEAGTFKVTFPEAGTYTLEVGGTASYESYTTISNAPVVPSRLTVHVVPVAAATVNVTMSDATGSFVTGKGGVELYRLPVEVKDSTTAPDGKITIYEVFEAFHDQYYDGAYGFYADLDSNTVYSLWGDYSGKLGYYLNDVYLDGSGTASGTNGRQFEDKLLSTEVETGDCLNAFLYQDPGKYSYTDVYTYFDPVTATATAGTAKTLTVKVCDEGMFGKPTVPAGAAIRVTDSDGAEQTALNTTVGADGSFTITFPAAGTYTVEVCTAGAVYVVPSRCAVTVSTAERPTPKKITVSISVDNPNGGYFLPETSYTVNPKTTAADLLLMTDLDIVSSNHGDYGLYVESINGIGEFDFGSGSGWMYSVNGEFPSYSSALYELSDGDYVEWVYTRDLGEDVGGGSSSGGATISAADRAAAREVKKLIEAIGTVTEESGDVIKAAREAYDDLTATQKKLVPNYDDLVAAEKAYAKLTGKLVFTDVAESDYFYEAVKWAAEQEITGGTSATTFSPYANCTRAQMVTFLWRAAGCPEPAGTASVFADVDQSAYYHQALLWAVESGITGGTSVTTFSPNAVCTRGQMAMFLYRSAKTPAVSGSNPFTDVSETAYYRDAVLWAKTEGITSGITETTFGPDAACTRAQMVTFLYRCLAE